MIVRLEGGCTEAIARPVYLTRFGRPKELALKTYEKSVLKLYKGSSIEST